MYTFLQQRFTDIVHTTQQTQNMCTTFIQRRPNVSDVGPTLYKCYTNVLCLLGSHADSEIGV